MNERELLLDCLTRLEGTGVEYLLTGSMASNYWGLPRTTHDLDFVIHLNEADIPRFTKAFQGEFYLDEDSIRDAWKPPYQFNFIDERSGLKVDFWMLRDKPFDTETFRRRKKVEILSVPAWIATAEDIILHKLYWNSLGPSDRQLGDVAGVCSLQGDSLDFDYLRKWGKELGVAETLDRILTGEIKPKLT